MFLKFDTFVIKITLSLTMMACVVAGQAQRIPQNLNKLLNARKKNEPETEPLTKKCPLCCSEIDIKAIKCPCCTGDIPQ